jgi:chromosome segregation ATPase
VARAIVALCSIWSSDSLHEQIANANAARQALTAELDRQRQAVGTFAELQLKIEQARTEAGQIVQESDHARLQLAATLNDLDVAQTNLAGTSADAHKEEERLSDLGQQYADTVRRLESVKTALAETLILHNEAQTKLQALEQRRAEMEQEGAIPGHARSNVW